MCIRDSVWTGRVNFDKAALAAPLAWKKPQRIFVNSMSDLFQDKADVAFIRQVWRVMEQAYWHSFQVLTKRPERMLDILSKPEFPMLPNVWLGTSVESEDYLDRIDLLQMCIRDSHLFIRQQTAVINAIRAHLAEFGIVAPVGRNGVEEMCIRDRLIPVPTSVATTIVA